jgi:restriction endonuclease Mrr
VEAKMDKLPTISELVEPTLKVLTLFGPMNHREIEKRVVEMLEIPEHLRLLVRTGSRTELNYRLSWTRTKCKSEGLITRGERGIWSIGR